MNKIQQNSSYWVFIIAGILSFFLATSPLYLPNYSLVFNYFASLPLFMVGLGWGCGVLINACGITFLLCAVVFNFKMALILAIYSLFPLLLITWKALTPPIHPPKGKIMRYSGGYLISWLTAIAIILFTTAAAVIMALGHDSTQLFHRWFMELTRDWPSAPSHLEMLAGFLPAIVGISWIIMKVVNLWLAQRILTYYGYSLRFCLALQEYQTPLIWDLILVVSLLGHLSGIPTVCFVSKNVSLFACVPLFFLGVQVAKLWLKSSQFSIWWLVLLLGTAFLLVWPTLFIVGLGISESWLNLCHRFKHRDVIKSRGH